MVETNTSPLAATTLTFLFTDLQGSIRLWQQYPEAMKTALARHDELVCAAVEGANGQVVKSTGDGFHAAYASAQNGLKACVQAQRSRLADFLERSGLYGSIGHWAEHVGVDLLLGYQAQTDDLDVGNRDWY